MSQYPESAKQKHLRENAFTYHPPIGNQAHRYELVRASVKELSRTLNGLCPASYELCRAQDKLEEAVFWANAAIARNESQVAVATGEGTPHPGKE